MKDIYFGFLYERSVSIETESSWWPPGVRVRGTGIAYLKGTGLVCEVMTMFGNWEEEGVAQHCGCTKCHFSIVCML